MDPINSFKLILARLSPQEREVVTRFYLLDQSYEQICEDLAISEQQLTGTKSRVKKLFLASQRWRKIGA